MGQLNGKVAMITGASRGIGRALAIGFAREGATVVAAARTVRLTEGAPPGSLEQTVAEITRSGGRAVVVPCDVADRDDVNRLAAVALERFGQVDVLVNNAGYMVHGDPVSYDPDWWDTTFTVNVKGPFLLCQAVLPHMMQRRLGSIINITSRLAGWATANDLAYGPSKAALDRFTVNLAESVREHGVAVNALGPGLVISEMTPAGVPNRQGRLPDPPEVVVPPAVWLAQQTAATFTGRIVHRDEFGKTWP